MAARVSWILAMIYAALLAAASLVPPSTGPKELETLVTPGVQNALHVPAYALLALLAGRAWCSSGRRVCRAVVVGLGCAAYGGLLEALQTAVPGRMGSSSDLFLDIVGVVVGLLVLVLWRVVVRARGSSGGASAGAAPTP